MALTCLATHAGDVPSAGRDVGNQTGTLSSIFFSACAAPVANTMADATRVDNKIFLTSISPLGYRNVEIATYSKWSWVRRGTSNPDWLKTKQATPRIGTASGTRRRGVPERHLVVT